MCTPCMIKDMVPGTYNIRVQNVAPENGINIFVSDEEYDEGAPYSDDDWITEMGALNPITWGQETFISAILPDGKYYWNLLVGTDTGDIAEINVIVEV